MSAEWTPPASGTPCWINIAAKDVARAKAFYSSVFSWTFEENADASAEHRRNYPSDEIAFFHPPDRKSSPGGGISKATGNVWGEMTTKNKGTASLYLYVDDLEKYMKKIEEAGGKKASEVIEESTHGYLQHFLDTEGNFMGVYMVRPPQDK